MADRLVGLGVTRREAEVLAALGEHLSNAEIAARLYVSERTVESHVSSLLRRFHATNRRQLLRLSSASTTGTPSDEAVAPATLTFLFTDIVDSTVLWERFPRLMPDALARHDAVIRGVVADHRGDVFTAAGDGFGVAFFGVWRRGGGA